MRISRISILFLTVCFCHCEVFGGERGSLFEAQKFENLKNWGPGTSDEFLLSPRERRSLAQLRNEMALRQLPFLVSDFFHGSEFWSETELSVFEFFLKKELERNEFLASVEEGIIRAAIEIQSGSDFLPLKEVSFKEILIQLIFKSGRGFLEEFKEDFIRRWPQNLVDESFFEFFRKSFKQKFLSRNRVARFIDIKLMTRVFQEGEHLVFAEVLKGQSDFRSSQVISKKFPLVLIRYREQVFNFNSQILKNSFCERGGHLHGLRVLNLRWSDETPKVLLRGRNRNPEKHLTVKVLAEVHCSHDDEGEANYTWSENRVLDLKIKFNTRSDEKWVPINLE